MLKKLRLKLVVTNMVLITLIITVAFGVIIYTSYRQAESDMNAALENALTADKANFRFEFSPFSEEESPAGINPPSELTQDGTGRFGEDYENRKTGDAHPSELHYIAVSSYLITADNSYTVLSEQVSINDIDTALSEVESTAEAGSGRLTQLGLYYKTQVTPAGTKVAFAPVDFVDNTVGSLALTLAAVGVGLFVVFLFLSILFSRWATKPVERAWIQQQRFVADASHELKTPLTVVLANNSILMDHPDMSVASQMQWVESTQEEAKLMQGLVDDLLVLAKPENNEVKLEYPELDFSALIEKSSLTFESVAFERQIELTSDVSEGCTLQGDETRLGRLVGVLIDNACKYAGENGHVDVRLSCTESHAKLIVSNTGTPIADEDLPHIFDRFYRSDKARVRSEGGFGLGLAIAKEICDEHKGTIEVTSDSDSGTAFTVTLPRHRR